MARAVASLTAKDATKYSGTSILLHRIPRLLRRAVLLMPSAQSCAARERTMKKPKKSEVRSRKSGPEDNNKRVLRGFFELCDQVHSEARCAGRYIINSKSRLARPHRAQVRALGKQLLACGGKPALEVAYQVPHCITTIEESVIRR